MECKFITVDQAFNTLVSVIHSDNLVPIRKTYETPSRYGDVLRFIDPVTIQYLRPQYRVLFNQARDCNPFFHVYEALWMLAGRNDVEPLAYYNSKMREFSDDSTTFHGAYGHRWRHWPGGGVIRSWSNDVQAHVYHPTGPQDWDQLSTICEQLRENPNCRRQVLAMWNPVKDCGGCGKDLPCNTQAYFDIVRGRLNMTVCNRSNDMVWGMLGANVVHFSFLQEYMAACIGVNVGVYTQFTNNLHVYTERFTPELWLSDTPVGYSQFGLNWKPFPLVDDPETFDEECAEFVERHKQDALFKPYKEPFLNYVAQPMCIAFHYHKRRKYDEALKEAKRIRADDWRIVCMNWLKKRQHNWEKKCQSQS